MPCYRPLYGWRSSTVGPSGKRPIVFDRSQGFSDLPVTLPCGQCIGCRLERSRQWAVRCMHEAQMHDRNCFITLTYDDEHLESWDLELEHFQKFMKRYRKAFGKGIRNFYCGEYGETFGRPHWHACIFNHDFEDKVPWKKNPNGDLLYQSVALATLWPFGFSSVGALTFQSAAYVARYCMKKITGEFAGLASQWKCPMTDQISVRRQPFGNMSRGSKKLGTGGLGKGWFEAFKDDVYPHDYVVVNGHEAKPPKFYDRLYEITEPDEARRLFWSRVRENKQHRWNQTSRRLRVREQCAEARVEKLVRNLD